MHIENEREREIEKGEREKIDLFSLLLGCMPGTDGARKEHGWSLPLTATVCIISVIRESVS